MSLKDWIVTLLRGPRYPYAEREKVVLDRRQVVVADKLARMQGRTRDEVLAEAYRRADQTIARRR